MDLDDQSIVALDLLERWRWICLKNSRVNGAGDAGKTCLRDEARVDGRTRVRRRVFPCVRSNVLKSDRNSESALLAGNQKGGNCSYLVMIVRRQWYP